MTFWSIIFYRPRFKTVILSVPSPVTEATALTIEYCASELSAPSQTIIAPENRVNVFATTGSSPCRLHNNFSSCDILKLDPSLDQTLVAGVGRVNRFIPLAGSIIATSPAPSTCDRIFLPLVLLNVKANCLFPRRCSFFLCR